MAVTTRTEPMSGLESIKSHFENNSRCIVNEEKDKLCIYMSSIERKPGEGRGVFATVYETAPGMVFITTSALKDGRMLHSSGTLSVNDANQFLSNISISKLAEHDKVQRMEKERQAQIPVSRT